MDVSEMLPQLFIGGVKASRDKDGLLALGITHIVNVSGKQQNYESIVYHRCFMKDGGAECFLELLLPAIDFMHNAMSSPDTKVLVHCQAGMSRSPSIVIGYLIAKQNMSLKDAFLLTKNKRPCIRPNIAYLKPLQDHEEQIRNTSSWTESRWPRIVKGKKKNK